MEAAVATESPLVRLCQPVDGAEPGIGCLSPRREPEPTPSANRKRDCLRDQGAAGQDSARFYPLLYRAIARERQGGTVACRRVPRRHGTASKLGQIGNSARARSGITDRGAGGGGKV